MLRLEPVTTVEQVEWIRVKRNIPEMYRYFRQDAPITQEQQKRWWNNLRKDRVKLFIITIPDTKDRIGYVGFNPFNLYAGTAEFGIFIIPEFQGKGYGREALLELLHIGFDIHNLTSIYSDVIDYPGENRFAFYRALGFEANAEEQQTNQYKKQGVWVKAIKFFMTSGMWKNKYGNKYMDFLRLPEENRLGGRPAVFFDSRKRISISGPL